MRTLAYSLISWLLLCVYGGKVCPIIDYYPLWKWSLLCLAGYVPAMVLHATLTPRLVKAAPLESQAGRQFRLEIALTVLSAALLWIGAHFIALSPWYNATKVSIGVLLLGLFFSLEISLARERSAVLSAGRDRVRSSPPGSYFPLTTKFALVAAAALVFGAVVVSGVVVKDIFVLFSGEMDDNWERNIRAVIIDISFVMGVLLAQGLLCLTSYARNLKLYFALQTRALERVAAEDLDAAVPVVTSDEFGLIAARTNQMIEGLRERRRIKDVFGKLVSPSVAQKLLSREGGPALGGERAEAAVLFADVRGFTALSESRPPEEVVSLLNALFTRLVEQVHARGGMVDKFIGDAVMAVFGLEGGPDPALRAVEAAMDMAGEQGPLGLGVGVHMGQVVAGNIGSPERLEYTVVGDTVNTASRLQDATRALSAPVAISARVYEALPEAVRARFEPRGQVGLKGKSEPMDVYTLAG